jgi:hypothetical protein
MVKSCIALELPNVTVPKFVLAGLSTIAAGVAPVPVSIAVATCPAATPVTVSTPCRTPAAVGSNTTVTLQLALPLSTFPAHPSVSTKSPVIATFPTAICPTPEFAIITVCAAELPPITVAGNVSIPGVSATVGGSYPVPLNATVCERNSSDTVIIAVTAPFATGVRVT